MSAYELGKTAAYIDDRDLSQLRRSDKTRSYGDMGMVVGGITPLLFPAIKALSEKRLPTYEDYEGKDFGRSFGGAVVGHGVGSGLGAMVHEVGEAGKAIAKRWRGDDPPPNDQEQQTHTPE